MGRKESNQTNKTLILACTGLTQEDPSRRNWKIVDWGVQESNQTILFSEGHGLLDYSKNFSDMYENQFCLDACSQKGIFAWFSDVFVHQFFWFTLVYILFPSNQHCIREKC